MRHLLRHSVVRVAEFLPGISMVTSQVKIGARVVKTVITQRFCKFYAPWRAISGDGVFLPV